MLHSYKISFSACFCTDANDIMFQGSEHEQAGRDRSRRSASDGVSGRGKEINSPLSFWLGVPSSFVTDANL